jgi:hypothetical protein
MVQQLSPDQLASHTSKDWHSWDAARVIEQLNLEPVTGLFTQVNYYKCHRRKRLLIVGNY